MMRTMVINENQRGLLYKNGRYVRMLEAGKYRLLGNRRVEVCDLKQPLSPALCGLDTLLADPAVSACTEMVEVRDGTLALHYVNGSFVGALHSGRYVFWSVHDRHSFLHTDITDPRPDGAIPTYVLNALTPSECRRFEIPAHHQALLILNGQVQGILESGAHYFWENGVTVEIKAVDTRMTQEVIVGQELLTADKVTIRVSLVCRSRVTDVYAALTENSDLHEQLHVAAQLALREYVGKYKLDEILDGKQQLSAYLFEVLRKKAGAWHVEIGEVSVKDMVLPGEIRDIMNTVLVAEKKAQANVIARREEVASTRSLLNTAKLMEENPTLYRLKELEYVERICENVGSITLNGGGDLPALLRAVLQSAAPTA